MLLTPTAVGSRPPLSIRPQRIESGLIAWYPLIGATSQRDELVAGRVTTTVLGTGQTDAASAPMGMVAESVNSAHTIPSSVTSLITTEATVSAWAKLRNATPVSDSLSGSPLCLDGDATVESHYPFTDGTIYTSCLRDTRVSFSPLANVNRAEWHLLTIASRPGTGGWVLYQNGRAVNAQTGVATITIDAGATFGGNDADFYMDGWMCDVRIWNRCLTSAEVYALYDPVTRWAHYPRVSHETWIHAVDVGPSLSALAGGSFPLGRIMRPRPFAPGLAR